MPNETPSSALARTYRIVVIEGDGVGPEVIAATMPVLQAAASKGEFRLDIQWHSAGAG